MKITVQQAIALAQDQEVYGVKLIKIDDSTTLGKLREYDDFVINEALITVKEEKEEAAEFKTEPQDKDLPGGITVNEDPPEKKKTDSCEADAGDQEGHHAGMEGRASL